MTDEPNSPATPEPGTQEREAPEAPERAPEGTPEVDWAVEGPRYKQRYEDLRPQYDRTQTEAQELREFYEALQDPEQAPELLQRLGYEVGEDDLGDDDLLDDDPNAELMQRLEALEGHLSQEQQVQQQQELQEAEFGYIDDQLSSIEKETGKQLDEEEANVVGTLALQLRDDRGRPDVQGAYERIYQTVLEKERGRWVDSKRRAPQVQSGSQAEDKPNLDDRDERRAWMAEQIRAQTEDD